MTSFNNCPAEIQQAIFGQFGDYSWSNVKDILAKCALVSKSWNALASPLLYQNVFIDVEKIPKVPKRVTRSNANTPATLYEMLLSKSNLAARVRRFNMTATYSRPYQNQILMSLLVSMTNLTEIKAFSLSAPTYLAASLDLMPHLRRLWVSYGGDERFHAGHWSHNQELQEHARFYQLLLTKGSNLDHLSIRHEKGAGMVEIVRRQRPTSVAGPAGPFKNLFDFLKALTHGGCGFYIVRFFIPTTWSQSLLQICSSINLSTCRQLHLSRSAQPLSTECWQDAAPLLLALENLYVPLGSAKEFGSADEFQHLIAALVRSELSLRLRNFSIDYRDNFGPVSDLSLVFDKHYPNLRNLHIHPRFPLCTATAPSHMVMLIRLCASFASSDRSDREASITCDFCCCRPTGVADLKFRAGKLDQTSQIPTRHRLWCNIKTFDWRGELGIDSEGNVGKAGN